MKKLGRFVFACVLAAGVLGGCAAQGESSASSASAASSEVSASSAAQPSSAAAASDDAAASAQTVASSDAPVASSDAVAVGSSDAAGLASSDGAGTRSSDAASSDAASSNGSSEPVLSGPSGLIENDVEMRYVGIKEVLGGIEAGDKTKLLVDLRKPEDYNAGHIKGAVNAPMNKVVDNNNYADGIANITATLSQVTGNEVGEGRDVVLVCYAGKKYAQAATDILNALGADMETVYTLEGGMTAWNDGGNPVVK